MKVDSVQPLGHVRSGSAPEIARADAVEPPSDVREAADSIALREPNSDILGSVASRVQNGDRAEAAIADAVKGVKSSHLLQGQNVNVRAIPPTRPGTAKAPASGNPDIASPAAQTRAATGAPSATAADPPAPTQLAKALGTATHVLEATERLAVPVTAAIDATRLVNAMASDGGQIGAQTRHVAGSVAGGWAGGYAGAEAGAAAGAYGGGAIGALFGGVGAVPGAAFGSIVGSLAGGIAGAMGGSWIGANVADTIENRH